MDPIAAFTLETWNILVEKDKQVYIGLRVKAIYVPMLDAKMGTNTA